MKKRTFTYVLALITIVCLLASSASAAAPDTLNGDTIQRRLTYIHSLARSVFSFAQIKLLLSCENRGVDVSSLRNKCRKPALFDHPFKAKKITLNVNFRKHRMV